MEKETNQFQEEKEQIIREVSDYAQAEGEVVRLKLIDKFSQVVGRLLLTVCLVLIAFAMLAFCAVAAVVALSQCMPLWAASLIIAGLYLLLIPVVLIGSKALFVNPIIRNLSGKKHVEELRYETLRAEGQAGVLRERLSGRVRFAVSHVTHYVEMATSVWKTVSGLFRKFRR